MFLTTLRTGIKPSGTPLAGDMPWQAYGQMTDDELNAVFLYLQTVPPAPARLSTTTLAPNAWPSSALNARATVSCTAPAP
jgi:mono/diheme cytochrome c family protein